LIRLETPTCVIKSPLAATTFRRLHSTSFSAAAGAGITAINNQPLSNLLHDGSHYLTLRCCFKPHYVCQLCVVLLKSNDNKKCT
jgi:hypothetical protein